MSYWDQTDRVLAENGGQNPPCPSCGEPLIPVDDHGRFHCWNQKCSVNLMRNPISSLVSLVQHIGKSDRD